MGAKDFLIGDDLNMKFKLETGGAGLEFQGLDAMDWYGHFGPECRGGGQCLGMYEKKLRWLQLLWEFGCVCDEYLGEL